MSNEAQEALTPVVFMDTETTGLALDDDIWEFAAIRREPDGSESSVHYFVKHNHLNVGARCKSLPESFRADHDARYDQQAAIEPWALSMALDVLFEGRPHVVGAVPNFDTERIAMLLRRNGHEPGWHYHLIDVENLAVGYLTAKGVHVSLPWDSDRLTELLGLDPVPESERHTAMGDVHWAQRIYDAILSQRLGGRA